MSQVETDPTIPTAPERDPWSDTGHADYCEAEPGHALDCATATRLARLTAFAEAVRDEIHCDGLPIVLAGAEGLNDQARADLEAAHRDDCFHCYALQALEPVR